MTSISRLKVPGGADVGPDPAHAGRGFRTGELRGEGRRRWTPVVATIAVAAAIVFGSETETLGQYATPPPRTPGSQAAIGRSPDVNVPQTNLAPIGNSPFSAPSASDRSPLAAPSLPAGPGNPPAVPPVTGGSTLFDPYATTPGQVAPSLSSPPPTGYPSSAYPNGSLLGRLFSGGSAPVVGAGAPATFPPPTYGAQPVLPPGSPGWGVSGVAPAPGAGGTAFPPSVYPSATPSTLFPGGLFQTPGGWHGGIAAPPPFDTVRFVQGPRLRHAYIAGDRAVDDLAINATDVSVAFAFPSFLYSTQPLYVVPSFSLHLWDGPQSTSASDSADLPPQVYGGFLDFGWQSDPNRMFGGEVGVRVGAFTDFDTFNDDSIRVRGKGLLSFRLTPASTLKGGVYYLDRDDVKLLPAGGILWQPNPFTRFDIFFPEPKFARFWRTLGRSDVWWYAAGDYGGGAWTIERADDSNDSVEMNDLRVLLGLEWGDSGALRAGKRTAFVEIGYVFEREVNYERNPEDDFDPDDAIMVRAGFGY